PRQGPAVPRAPEELGNQSGVTVVVARMKPATIIFGLILPTFVTGTRHRHRRRAVHGTCRRPGRDWLTAGVEIAAFQDLMARTYGERDRARGIDATIAWLTEELGELA